VLVLRDRDLERIASAGVRAINNACAAVVNSRLGIAGIRHRQRSRNAHVGVVVGHGYRRAHSARVQRLARPSAGRLLDESSSLQPTDRAQESRAVVSSVFMMLILVQRLLSKY
jgi:hypothetical protein